MDVRKRTLGVLIVVAIIIGAAAGYGISFIVFNPMITDLNQKSADLQSEIEKPKPSQEWHHIVTLNGTGPKKSQVFFIQGDKWRIKWTSTPCQIIGLAVYSEDNTLVSLDNFWMQWFKEVPTTEGIVYIPEGDDNFYIKVFATPQTPSSDATSWTLEVESWH